MVVSDGVTGSTVSSWRQLEWCPLVPVMRSLHWNCAARNFTFFSCFFTRIVWVDVPAVLTSKSQEVKSLRIRIPMASIRILWRSVCHPERLDLSGCQRDGPETAGRREFDPAVINRRKFHQEARDAARISGVGCAESGTVSSGRKNLMTTVFICSARSRD